MTANLKQLEKEIVLNLQANYQFKKSPVPGVKISSQLEESGFLDRVLTMSDMRCALLGQFKQNDQSIDGQILKVFDTLASSGRVLFGRVWQDRNHRNIYDYSISMRLGYAVKSWKSDKHFGRTGGYLKTIVWYSDIPLSKSKRDPKAITSISLAVEEVNKDIDRRLRKQFGDPDLEIESRLHREDAEDEAKMKRILSKLVDPEKLENLEKA